MYLDQLHSQSEKVTCCVVLCSNFFFNLTFKSGEKMRICVDATLATATLKLFIEEYKSRKQIEIYGAVSA